MVHKSGYFFVVAIALAAFIGVSQGANILGLFPSLSPSHVIIQMSAAKVLAEKGHNVTVVSVLKPVVTHKNIKVIQVPLTKEESQQMSDTIGAMSKSDNSNMILSLIRMSGQMDFMYDKMAEALKNDRVRDLSWVKGCVRPHPSREILPPLGLWHVLRHVLSGFTGRASLRDAINLLSSLCLPNVYTNAHIRL